MASRKRIKLENTFPEVGKCDYCGLEDERIIGVLVGPFLRWEGNKMVMKGTAIAKKCMECLQVACE